MLQDTEDILELKNFFSFVTINLPQEIYKIYQQLLMNIRFRMTDNKSLSILIDIRKGVYKSLSLVQLLQQLSSVTNRGQLKIFPRLSCFIRAKNIDTFTKSISLKIQGIVKSVFGNYNRIFIEECRLHERDYFFGKPHFLLTVNANTFEVFFFFKLDGRCHALHQTYLLKIC